MNDLKKQAESLGIKVDGRWSDKRIQEEIEKATPERAAEAVEEIQESDIDQMNDLANRIWHGQSVSLPKTIRMQRIILRLKDKGYTDKDLESLNIG